MILLLLSSGINDHLDRLWFFARSLIFWRENLGDQLLLRVFGEAVDSLLDEILEVSGVHLLALDEQMVQQNHLVHLHKVTSDDGPLLLDAYAKLRTHQVLDHDHCKRLLIFLVNW